MRNKLHMGFRQRDNVYTFTCSHVNRNSEPPHFGRYYYLKGMGRPGGPGVCAAPNKSHVPRKHRPPE
jgi:hypothetical protein